MPQDPSNTAVVEAMRSVASHDTPQTRALLFQLLLDTRLVVATRGTPAEGGRTVREGEHLDLLTLAGEPGQGPVLPVFTSLDTLLAWRPLGGGYLVVPSRSLFELAAANHTSGIVIDPGSPTRGTILREELQALARGRIRLGTSEVVPESTRARIGPPVAPPPAGAIRAVRAALEEEPLAVGAFAFVLEQGGAAPELCIGGEPVGRGALAGVHVGAGRAAATPRRRWGHGDLPAVVPAPVEPSV
ncbi:MAG TPA: SseB family protein [Actinomycetes bacterium]|nr:SseB family protein [Actinomycetes bacterium]